MRSTVLFIVLLGLLGGVAVLGCGGRAPARPPEEPGDIADLVARVEILAPGAPRLVRLSPDGRHLAYVAEQQGAQALWVERLDGEAEAKVQFSGRAHAFQRIEWSLDSRFLLIAEDSAEGLRQFLAFDPRSAVLTELTPSGADARLLRLSPRRPESAVFSVRESDTRPMLVDLASAEGEVLDGGDFASWVVDGDLQLRLGARPGEDGSLEYFRISEFGDWVPFEGAAGVTDRTFSIVGIDDAGESLYWQGRDDGGRAAVVRTYLSTGESEILVSDPEGRRVHALTAPATGRVDAVVLGEYAFDWRPVTTQAAETFVKVHEAFSESPWVADRSLDDGHWLVVGESRSGHRGFHLLERETGQVQPLFPAADSVTWARATSAEMRVTGGRGSEDAVRMTLTLPAGMDPNGDGFPAKPLPTVLRLVPEMSCMRRDAVRQWLANRGYAVAELDGSDTSLEPAEVADWLVDERIALRESLAIAGEQDGAREAIAEISGRKPAFACALSLFPGSLAAEADPIAGVKRPLLLARRDDGTARPAWPESTTVVSIAGESPTTLRIETQLALATETESFLGECLGGRVEPAEGLPARQATLSENEEDPSGVAEETEQTAETQTSAGRGTESAAPSNPPEPANLDEQ